MLAAGVTVRLDPMTTQRSAFSAWPKLVSSMSVWCGGVVVCGGEDVGKMLAEDQKVVIYLLAGSLQS